MVHKVLSAITVALGLITLLMACISQPSMTADKKALFQTSTLSALQAGVYDGALTIGELKQHGNFGLGTFNALDGEMVVVDGQVYQIKDDGQAYAADDAMQTPFAAVTFFEPDQQFTMNETFDCSQLQAYLDELLPAGNMPYAIKVSGTFAQLKVRAPHKESQPYPTLAEALSDQAVFETENIAGDMVGFRLPDYMAGLNAAGYHFHFISADRQTGGHVLACQTGDLAIAIDTIDQFEMEGIQSDIVQDAARDIAAPEGAESSSMPPASSEPVILGALYNLTGAQAQLDTPSAQGAQLAIAEANQAGGVLGRPVELVMEDGETNPTVLAEKTTDILTQHPDVSAFLGLSDTDMVLAAAPVAAENGRLFLTSGATSPQLPDQVPHSLFLACFGDNVQAAAAAEWAYEEQSAATAAILFDESMSYTQLLQGYFATRFEELGGKIVSSQSYTTGDSDGISQAIAQLTQADIIFVAAGPEDAPVASRQLRDAGFTAPILGGDGFDSGALWQQYADLDNIYFTTHAYLGEDNPDPQIQAFRTAYMAAYPDSTPDAFAALGYDATRLLIQAIAQADSAAPEDIQRALATIEQFDGVTGTMSFSPASPIPNKSVTILEVNHGDYQFVSQVMPKSVPDPN
ncbi:MAG: acetolactate decarboxylase [Anaerolineae bacterium]|nr:acetolactate decarboxylase [Anaerolineae bacterium]